MPTIACQVSASNQDCLVAKNLLGNWTISLTHNQASVGYHDVARYAQGAGLYFPNVPIPPGSTIVQAFLILRASDFKAFAPCKAKIRAELNATPAPFSTLADYQARPRTLQTVLMDYFANPWSKDKLYASHDIKGMLQTIINLPAWAQGNPFVLFWDDHDEESYVGPAHEREAYSWNANAPEAPRLEITYEPSVPPTPPPPWPLPVPPSPIRKGWCGLDLQYEYLDTGFLLTFHTDTPCHLWCRMTTTPPRKHALPSRRRGLFLTGDIRFCFVNYEDNEQLQAGDSIVHTFVKDNWPICQRRWFYFIGRVYGDLSPSESPIFEFHFPSPPPAPPPPMVKTFIATSSNRTIRSNNIAWPPCRAGSALIVGNWHNPPLYRLITAAWLTASFFITRSFLFFDTTSLPATAKMVNAKLRFYAEIENKTSSIAHPYIQLMRGVQSDPVIVGDWGTHTADTLILGQIHLDNIITGQYNDIDLNLPGLNWITPGGVTKFCLRQQMDVDDFVPPLGTNELAYHSQQKGVGFYPLLEVHYYPA